MFKNLKPLPKALLIAVMIAVPVGAYVKFAPRAESVVAPVEEAEVAVPVEVVQVAPSAPLVAEVETTTENSTGNAGMEALLKAGKKGN